MDKPFLRPCECFVRRDSAILGVRFSYAQAFELNSEYCHVFHDLAVIFFYIFYFPGFNTSRQQRHVEAKPSTVAMTLEFDASAIKTRLRTGLIEVDSVYHLLVTRQFIQLNSQPKPQVAAICHFC